MSAQSQDFGDVLEENTEILEDANIEDEDQDSQEIHQCNICYSTFKDHVDLQAHEYLEHYENPKLSTRSWELTEKLQCRVCLKFFR